MEYGEHMWDCGLATSALADPVKYRKHWLWREDIDDASAAKVCVHFTTPVMHFLPEPGCRTEEHY